MNYGPNLTKMTNEQIQKLNPSIISLYNVSALKYAVKKGYNIHKIEADGKTLLYRVAMKGFINHVKFLLEQDVDPNIKVNGKYIADIIYKTSNKTSNIRLKKKLKQVLKILLLKGAIKTKKN